MNCNTTHYRANSSSVPGDPTIPLDYEAAKKLAEARGLTSFYKDAGTLPWRVNQLDALLRESFRRSPAECPKSPEVPPSLLVITYAGLLTHYLSDASVPLHSAKDYDGVEAGLKGVHAYFESDLVAELEPDLEKKVEATGLKALLKPANVPGSLAALRASAEKQYPALPPERRTQALASALLLESFSVVPMVFERDRKYALASDVEKKAGGCYRGAGTHAPELCRRAPATFVDARGRKTGPRGGKTVAGWNENLIVERLAIASALMADAWARAWIESGKPNLCFTWAYAHRPNFVGPGDAGCLGYAPKEETKPTAPQSKLGHCLTEW